MSYCTMDKNKQAFYEMKKGLQTFTQIDEIVSILNMRFKDFAFHALKDIPHPKELLNNMEASLLVCQSMLQNKKIVIVGDYDTDGICATCIMLDFFEQLSYSNVAYAIPNRFIHGYGFSKKLFHEILQNHPDVCVIITVDNGVSSFEAGELCKEHNIHFIITDHHTLEVDGEKNVRIPNCDFLINPQQKNCNFPYKNICGSLVAWYFCCAIKINMQNFYNTQESFENVKKSKKQASRNIHIHNLSHIRMEFFLTLVGIAIIADVMPLNAINHTICKYAIRQIPISKRHAFQVFIGHLKCEIDSQVLGFRLIPLLNAAGRISDGKIALDFLRANSIIKAKGYFKQLKALNAQRKQLQDEVTSKAFYAITQIPQNKNMLCAVGNNWHEGVLGIVAGKMADEFQKPCFVLTNINGICKGSGRSCGDVDLIASMQNIGHLTQRYGGHVGAVGLEIKHCDIESFIADFEPVLCNVGKKESVLGILQPHLITHELLEHVARFEPYGNGNPLPKFFVEMPILECRKTGQGFIEFHFKPTPNRSIKGMFFNPKYAQHNFYAGEILQFRATIGLDTQSSHSAVQPENSKDVMLIIDKIYGLQDNPL